MRRAICYVEPSVALAGEVNTWKLVYSPTVNLPKGTLLKLDLCSEGREIDWEIPQASLKASKNVIYAHLKDEKPIKAVEVEEKDSYEPSFEFTLPAQLKAGGKFTIVMGAPKEKKPSSKNGNASQTVSQRRKQFLLYVDPKGKGKYGDPEIFTIDIRGSELDFIRIISPSVIKKNKRFDVTLRFEDEYGNLTKNAPEGTLINLSHDLQRENLNWTLFVPETGFITLPNIYFTEEGIYRIKLDNLKTKQTFYSAPIQCFSDDLPNIHWGLLHGESEKFDSIGNVEECIRNFRDEHSFNFFGTSNFENDPEVDESAWKTISQHAAELNEKEHFTTFLGFQWCGKSPEEGIRHIIYTKDSQPLINKSHTKTNSLKKIYKNTPPKSIISIPTFTMGKKNCSHFKNFNPEFERVVEIYNAWGSSEDTGKNGNPFKIHGGKGSVKEDANGSLQQALKNNCRFGFVAGGLDDRGIYSNLYENDQEQYEPGLTAIRAHTNSREDLIEAVYQRSCYATTGERILLSFFIAEKPMGQEISNKDKPGLAINRHITGKIAGTSDLKKVEIIRNGKVLKKFKPKSFSFELEFDDMSPLEKISIKKDKTLFSYYYLRITQKDGHMAWSSPIWVDFVGKK